MQYTTTDELVTSQINHFLELYGRNDPKFRKKSIIFNPVEFVPIEKLKVKDALAKSITTADENKIKDYVQLMLNHHAFAPIIIDAESKIIFDGNHRYRASIAANFTHIPVIYFTDNSED